MLRYEIYADGLDELADAFINAPTVVAKEAAVAGREASDAFLRYAREETPVRTGFLRESEEVVMIGPFYIEAQATAGYAGFVHDGTRHMAPNPFFDRATTRFESEVEAIYEDAIERVAHSFGDGR